MLQSLVFLIVILYKRICAPKQFIAAESMAGVSRKVKISISEEEFLTDSEKLLKYWK